jgi:hypothetical protein
MDNLKVGPLGSGGAPDNTIITPRASRNGSKIIAKGQGDYYENVSRGLVYSLMMSAWTTNISAGNILGAAAAASTQFALWNPAGSGVNLSLLKFSLNIISGTAPIAGLWHSVAYGAPSIASTLAVTSYVGNHNAGIQTYNGKAGYLTHVTGAALTGGGTTRGVRLAGLNITAGTYASLAGTWFMDEINGDIVLPPNTLWIPSWAAQGTSVLGGYSITWEELPV